MEVIQKLLTNIEKIILNVKKNPKRIYSDKYVLNNLTILEDYYDRYKNAVHTLNDNSESKTLKEQFLNSYNFLKDFLKTQQQIKLTQSIGSDVSDFTEIEMAKFDLYQSMKIIPEFKNNSNDIDTFLGIIKLMNDSLDDTEKQKLIDFVWLLKLDSITRTKIGIDNKPKNYDNLELILNKVNPNKDNLQILHSELSNLTQNGLSLDSYITKIENLIQRLVKLSKNTIKDGDSKTIEKLNEELALNSFKRGLLEPLRTNVVSSKPQTFLEAVNTAKELDLLNKSSSSYNVNYMTQNIQNKKHNNKNGKNKERSNQNRSNYNNKYNNNKYFNKRKNFNKNRNGSNTNKRQYNSNNHSNHNVNQVNSTPKNGNSSPPGEHNSHTSELNQQFQNLNI